MESGSHLQPILLLEKKVSDPRPPNARQRDPRIWRMAAQLGLVPINPWVEAFFDDFSRSLDKEGAWHWLPVWSLFVGKQTLLCREEARWIRSVLLLGWRVEGLGGGGARQHRAGLESHREARQEERGPGGGGEWSFMRLNQV